MHTRMPPSCLGCTGLSQRNVVAQRACMKQRLRTGSGSRRQARRPGSWRSCWPQHTSLGRAWRPANWLRSSQALHVFDWRMHAWGFSPHLEGSEPISYRVGFTMLPVRLPHPATAVSPTATSPQCFRFPGLPLGANALPLSCRRSCSLAGETDLRQHAWLSRRRPPRVRSLVTRIRLPIIT